MHPRIPKSPIPEPLRGCEMGGFAHYTVVVRLPEIGRETIATNRFSPEVREKLQSLVDEIPEGPIRYLEDTEAPDAADWSRYIAPYLGCNWLEVPWFFAETYFYRRVLEATGYFSQGDYQGYDPYFEQKKLGLSLATQSICAFYSQVFAALEKPEPSSLERLFVKNVWGNQADLSVWSIGEDQRPDHQDEVIQKHHLVVNHAALAAEEWFSNRQAFKRVDFILDNAGQELACDLGLVYFLLRSRLTESAHLHLRSHPTFVSDAMIKDVYATLDALSASAFPEVSIPAKQLRSYIEDGRLHLGHHFFWTSPLPLWEMPPDLYAELSQADLLISKGDLNYRRMIGDCHWQFSTPLEEVLNYLPTSLLALRVLKAECVIGLSEEKVEELNRQDPEWLFNGRWGVIQFYLK